MKIEVFARASFISTSTRDRRVHVYSTNGGGAHACGQVFFTLVHAEGIVCMRVGQEKLMRKKLDLET
jgi:hypothetical protein